MTYVADESSVESGAPIELYEFIGSDPAVNTFRYTSADEDVTFDPGDGGGSRTFTALTIKRSGVELNPDGEDPSITVTVPTDSALASRYAFAVAPPDLYMTLFRCHIGVGSEEVITAWEGDVLSWKVDGHFASFVVPNELVARNEEVVPRIKYQRYCNNALYDDVCGETKTGSNVQAATVSSFPDEKTVVVSTVGGHSDGHWAGGEVTHDATGESRMIMTQVGTSLTIMYPFSTNVDTTEDVTLALGCDHSLNDCAQKFSQPRGNQDNFTGFPFIVSQQTNSRQDGN